MNNENLNNNVDTQSNINDIPVNDVPTENYDTPITENIGYDMPNGEFFEDSQSNINKSINNPTAVVDQYNQVSNGYIDDSEGISSYEDQIENSEDISLYTQQSNNNYNDEYLFNEDIDNYGYDDGYGYDNQYYDDNTVAYNNSGYSEYGNNFNELNSGGYNMNGNFTVAQSYAPPTNNMVNFTQQPVQTVAVQPIPTIQVVPGTIQTVAMPTVLQPTAGELISDGTNHPKTIGPDEFNRKVRQSRRPFNFILLIVYAIIIGVIGYFGYSLWLEKNAYVLSKDRMNIVQGHGYTEVIYEKGKLDLNTNYIWKSENEDIATVDENGKITAIKEGTATITVKSKKTKKVRKIILEVANIQINTFEISPKDKILKVGDAYNIYPTVNGSSKYLVNMEWKSSNENVASVSNEGVVTTKTPGSATITVTIPNTKFKASMNVKVK